MAATYGMRAGQHIKLTKEGAEAVMRGDTNFAQMISTAMQITGANEPIQGCDRQLMFAARLYRCAHCGTRYESLPNLMGAVKCRNCGSPEIGEEP